METLMKAILVATVALGMLASAGQVAARPKPQRLLLTVNSDGFEPTPVHVQKGVPVELVVTRTTDRTCAKQIVLPGYGVRAELPLNEPVTVRFTPTTAGELRYGCAMNLMVGGVIVVE